MGGQQLRQQPHPPSVMVGALIDVQIHGAAMALRQPQQGQQGVPILATGREGSPQHPAEHPPTVRQPPGQGLPLRSEPVKDRHQRHQLEIQAPLPTAAALLQHLPTRGRPRPQTVDMAAECPQSVLPGQSQGPIRPGFHHRRLAFGRLPPIGDHGGGHSALGVDLNGGAEGLVEVNVGIHQWRERQGEERRRTTPGIDRLHPIPIQAELHGHQSIAIDRAKIGTAGIQQGPGQPQRRQNGPPILAAHGRGESTACSWAESNRKRPATARVRASKRGRRQRPNDAPPRSVR